MRRLLPTSALVLAASLALVGCSLPGGDAPNGPEEQVSEEQVSAGLDATPASGPLVSGTGYTLNAPEGWLQTDEVAGTDVVVVDQVAVDGFAANLNVVVSPAGLISLDTYETAGIAELEAYGATDIVVNDRFELDGVEVGHVSGAMSAQGMTYRSEQYAINSDDQTYILSFAFNDSVASGDRIALAETVLVTWSFD